MKILLLVSLFVVESLQQEPSLKCDPKTINRSYFGASYSVAIYASRCVYANIKSIEDLDKARKAMPGFRGNQIVSVLAFENSSLSKLPDKMFEGYSTIRSLEASRLVLGEISTTAFFDVKSWDSIDLSFNQIRKLEARTFSTMQIMSLDLSQNLIESIDDSAFTGASIQKLNLAFNQMKSLQFLGAFTMFLTIEMNDNLLEKFDLQARQDVFKTRSRFLDEVEHPKFFLQRNKFKTFECNSNIKIGAIALENTQSLVEVALKECEVDELEVSNCENLRRVSLNDNLSEFTAKNANLNDVDISQAKSLTSLSLANASISPAVLENILKMENLTFLDLSYIPIGPLNVSTFAKLKNLQFLKLKATNISNIQFGTFSHQRAVKEFDISENHLGYFDMNMIFSMNSLLSLDLAGNDLTSLEHFESAHFTFTLLQKVDLSDNKLPCSYLMRLMRVFVVYKVVLTRSNIEEEGTNIHGVKCVHTAGEDDGVIEPLSPSSANITEMREKVNTLIEKADSNSKFRAVVDSRLNALEMRIDNQISSRAAISASLRDEKAPSIEVRNSALLETALIIVCICLSAFVVTKIFVNFRRNFLGKPIPMRSTSERHLTSMTVDDF